MGEGEKELTSCTVPAERRETRAESEEPTCGWSLGAFWKKPSRIFEWRTLSAFVARGPRTYFRYGMGCSHIGLLITEGSLSSVSPAHDSLVLSVN